MSVVRTRWFIALTLAVALFGVPDAVLGQIGKPVRGQKYVLAPNHGPWMIMVTSFSLPPGVDSADEIPGGMTPDEAANELVFELRTHGVPAYTYTLGEKVESINTVDRLADPVVRTVTAQQQSVCVLAGNYASIDPSIETSKTAIQTLKWMKNYRPKVFADKRPKAYISFDMGPNPAVGESVPLRGAFFTVNPLAAKGSASQGNSERANLMKQLNTGDQLSLFNNKGKYTLVVASFHGRKVLENDSIRKVSLFNEDFGEKLNQAARDAWELATYMRQINYEAEVHLWHDESCSVVTVGAFESLEDPAIPKLIEKYKAKVKTNAETKRDFLAGESLTIPLEPGKGEAVQKRWLFDPTPRLMKVPVLQ